MGVYHVFYQYSLDPTEFKLSDTIQFRQANKSLYERMRSNPSFRKTIQSKYPGIWEHVQPSKRGNFSVASPPGTTWHHADKPGALQLVDYKDHRTYHKVYHPDGTGGRNKWGGGTSCRK
ncbi:HNH endonuclease [Pelistega ratti]|uniref:HNH endonuclease n=1 Tax=Pelistega ratti TaxID=2652177 RepID=UPI0039A68D00